MTAGSGCPQNVQALPADFAYRYEAQARERQSLESAMRLNRLLLIAFALVIGMLPARSGRLRADGGDPPPLAGRV